MQLDLLEVNVEMIAASDQVREVMREFYQIVLDRKDMPNDWKTSVLVPIYKGKGDV